jgi:hypothetical protein
MIRVDAGVFRAAQCFVNFKDIRPRLHGVRRAVSGEAGSSSWQRTGMRSTHLGILKDAAMKPSQSGRMRRSKRSSANKSSSGDDGTIESQQGKVGFGRRSNIRRLSNGGELSRKSMAKWLRPLVRSVDVFAPVVAASKLTATKYPSVVLHGQGDGSILVTFPARPDSLAVVMSLRNTKASCRWWIVGFAMLRRIQPKATTTMKSR